MPVSREVSKQEYCQSEEEEMEEGEGDDEDNDIKPDFDCYSKIRISKVRLLCNVTKFPPGMVNNITFTVQNLNRKNEKWSENKHFEFHLILGEYKVCIDWKKSHYCKNINVKNIAIPDSPYDVTITYNRYLMEYELNIFLTYDIESEYLGKRMCHEIVLRKEGMPWPDCNEISNIGSYKVYFKTTERDLHIPKRNLEYSTKYEARVRSIPTGGFYDGFWSPWSPITTFWTEQEPVTDTEYVNNTISIALSIGFSVFLFFIVILIAVFWEKKIKPLVWPEIPDKKTLEKFLNKPNQNLPLSFNPDYSEILPINIIDYMKAREIPEDNHEISMTDSLIEKPSIHPFHFNLSPPEGSRGFPANTNNSGQCKGIGDDGGDRSENPIISGDVTLLSGDGSNGTTSVAVKHPENGLRRLCWEDIYIAMSAFKTPSSAVKQVPKNTF
ncbi:interleukin-7 receptor subunit alpha isoform X2 [Hyla sarda]|uniref:interleukin-7 receptor subunit alpha isoform X2 n=1 Tax=Hyla sarda TaxID=327740 RepID=UPI0024C40809|nr:interleukin-7 receptor subunit alpha isoform X2 [Hyla sarda]